MSNLYITFEKTYLQQNKFQTFPTIVSKLLFFLNLKAFFGKKISIKSSNSLKYCTKYDREVIILSLFNCKYCQYVKKSLYLFPSSI